LAVVSSIATFSSALPLNIGVGDALELDTDNSGTIDASDEILFIHERFSNTQYYVRKADGSAATDTSSATEEQWNIFRAYTALANAEAGTENTGIDADLVNFDTFSGGKDISTAGSSEQWNIALYADAADTAEVDIDGWTTDAEHYIKVYTPTRAPEVGQSQRHNGVWSDAAYTLATGDTANEMSIGINDQFVRVEGLQISNADPQNSSGPVWVSWPGGKPLSSRVSKIQRTRPSSPNKVGEILIDRLISGIPASRQVSTSLIAVARTQRAICGSTPTSSASATKASVASESNSGLFQRTSASTPTIWPLWISTMG